MPHFWAASKIVVVVPLFLPDDDGLAVDGELDFLFRDVGC